MSGKCKMMPGGKRRATLTDVAERAGFHRTTVSQVLNNYKNNWASEATRKKIRQAAEELGYRPNITAKSLKSGQSYFVGLVSPGFGVTSQHSWAHGLTAAATEADYTVALCSHPNDSDSEDRAIRQFLDRGVDGLAVYPVDRGQHIELRKLVESGFPVVTFEGANLLDFLCDDASVDLISEGRLQAKHLLELRRRRICIANAVPAARVNEIREFGIKMELESVGASAPTSMDIHRPSDSEFSDAEIVYEGISDYIKEHAGEFDAVVSYDPVASIVVRALLEQGMKVPDDVAVMGAGDEIVSSHGVIPLTTINARTDGIAVQAFGLLLDRIQGRVKPANQFRRLTSQVELVVRQSTVS